MARRAKIKRQEERDKFYIITNGKRTEYNYFTLLKSKKSIYDVKVEFINSDPYGLVECASRLVPESNQVWVVFDVDMIIRQLLFQRIIGLCWINLLSIGERFQIYWMRNLN